MGGDREVDALPMPRNGLTALHKRGLGRVMGSEAALQTTAPLILVTMQATRLVIEALGLCALTTSKGVILQPSQTCFTLIRGSK